MSEKSKYVTYGSCGCGSCGASKEVTGCRFSLAPMSDKYIDIILGALDKVDTSKVWKDTDKLSTIYRGKKNHVLDSVKACFMHSYKEGIHMTMEGTISRGCPGDTDADSLLAEDDILMNESKLKNMNFEVDCKISLYPMGVSNYMEYIANVVNNAIDRGIYVKSAHYVTILRGYIHELFKFFEDTMEYCSEELSHYVMQFTLSVNSPTKE